MKQKTKIILIKIGAYFASITPILVTIGFNWNDYFATTYGTVKLSFGAILCLVFLFLKSIGKLKLPEKRVVLYLIIFMMAYLLESVLYDLVLLSGMALLGEVIQLPLEKVADKQEEQIKTEKTAKETAKQINNLIRDNNEGRV